MDYFSVLFESVCLLAQSAIQLIFVSRLLGKKYGIWCFVLYPGILFILEIATAQSTIMNTLVIGMQLLLLSGISLVTLEKQMLGIFSGGNDCNLYLPVVVWVDKLRTGYPISSFCWNTSAVSAACFGNGSCFCNLYLFLCCCVKITVLERKRSNTLY